MRTLILLILFAQSPFVLPGAILAAELTKEEKKTQTTIENVIRSAARNYAAEKYNEAGEAVRRAMREVDAAISTGSPDLFEALQPSINRISRAHTLLEFEGITLPPLRTRKPPKANMKAEVETTPASSSDISFTKTVAPILLGRCGNCHVTGTKGKFSMATYTALMKGPPEGVVIFAGDSVGSRLIETIESGDMPRGGGKVMPEELAILKSWIQSGAKFDGDEPDKPINGRVVATSTAASKPMVRAPTGNETVSFSKEVAPLLIDNCKGCHLDAMTTRGGLRMDTFAQLLRGGDSGSVIQNGSGDASLLIKKLKGTEGQRMPAGGRPPLSDEDIGLISQWIDEGATLDGASPAQPLTVMSQLAWANSATADEMSERRKTTVERNLKLAVASGSELQRKTTENFYVIGLVASGTIDLVAQTAEDRMKQVSAVVPGGENAIFRGRATIVVLPKRYDYSEFAKMIEQRSLPSDWDSHWNFDGIDAYVAVVASDRDDEPAISERLASPLVSLAVAAQGSGVPFWIAQGVGAVTTTGKSGRRDRLAMQKEEAELMAAVGAIRNAKQFLDGKLTPDQTVRTGTALVATMLEGKRRRGYDKMMQELTNGMPFEQAFGVGFGMSVEQYVDGWLRTWRQ